jgi:hypoxanthine-guanine phosphoribosyltransferase
VDFTPDFVGFTVEDRFVVGYGLDDAEADRNFKGPWCTLGHVR